MSNILRAFRKLVRKDVIIAYGWSAFIGLITASRGFPPLLTSIFVLFAIGFAVISVYIYNDINDIEIDKINPTAQNRALPSGKVTRKEAEILVLISTLVATGLGLLVNINTALSIIFFITLGYLYSSPKVRLKERFLLNQVILGLGGTLSVLIGGFAIENLSGPVIYGAVLFFVLSVGWHPIVHMRDIKGDKQLGKNTIPVVLGPKTTIRFAVGTLIAIAVATLLGYSQVGFNTAFPILTTAIFIVWIYATYPLIKHWQDSVYLHKIISKRIIPIYLITQLCVFIGAL